MHLPFRFAHEIQLLASPPPRVFLPFTLNFPITAGANAALHDTFQNPAPPSFPVWTANSIQTHTYWSTATAKDLYISSATISITCPRRHLSTDEALSRVWQAALPPGKLATSS
ncbi:hypothetical protein TgHK011_007470 [Trichoderma gracile]|nr:hypothetical protein TgHK011_007470 [Trichoderma gracile]